MSSDRTDDALAPVSRLSRAAVNHLLADVPPEMGWKQIGWSQGNAEPWGDEGSQADETYVLTSQEQDILAELRQRIDG
jgi:hypothetical protein